MTEPHNREGVPGGHRRLSRRIVIIGGTAVAVAAGVGGGIWWLNSPHPLSTYRGHTDTVNVVVWSPDGTRIASSSWDKTVQVWNSVDSAPLFTSTVHFQGVNFTELLNRVYH